MALPRALPRHHRKVRLVRQHRAVCDWHPRKTEPRWLSPIRREHDLSKARLLKARRAVRFTAEAALKPVVLRLRHRRRHRTPPRKRAGLHDRRVEQVGRARRHEMVRDGRGASTLAKESHARRVAAKLPYIPRDPAECQPLVFDAPIASRARRMYVPSFELGTSEKPKCPYTIVEGHDEDGLAQAGSSGDQRCAIEEFTATKHVASAVDPHHHRKRRMFPDRTENIHTQTVLFLSAAGAEECGFGHMRVVHRPEQRDRYRRAPAHASNRGQGVSDA
eukprot:5344485-Pleurochrysis_carterae.AAC.8